MDAAKNFAKSTLGSGITAGATSLSVTSGGGAKFPAAPFNATIWNYTDYADPSDDPDREIVRVTAIATDTLTIARAQEGTADVAHNTGGKSYKIIAGLTAKMLADMVGLEGAKTVSISGVTVTDFATVSLPAATDVAAGYIEYSIVAKSTADVTINAKSARLRYLAIRDFGGGVATVSLSAEQAVVLDRGESNFDATLSLSAVATSSSLITFRFTVADGSGANFNTATIRFRMFDNNGMLLAAV